MRPFFCGLLAACALLCVVVFSAVREDYAKRFLEAQKVRSTITPQAEHCFAKICDRGSEEAVRQELRLLAERYEQGSAEFGYRCTVRWECDAVESLFVDAIEIRVFVKQHPW